MKRIGKEKCIVLLKEGCKIAYREWFMINSGFRVECGDNCIGYITFDLWLDLHKNGVIVAERKNSWVTYYKINE